MIREAAGVSQKGQARHRLKTSSQAVSDAARSGSCPGMLTQNSRAITTIVAVKITVTITMRVTRRLFIARTNTIPSVAAAAKKPDAMVKQESTAPVAPSHQRNENAG